MKKLLLITLLTLGLYGGTFASTSFTVENEGNVQGQTFNGDWRDGMFHHYGDNGKVVGQIHFVNHSFTVDNTHTEVINTSENVCKVKSNTSYRNIANAICQSIQPGSCDTTNELIRKYKLAIAELEASIYWDTVNDSSTNTTTTPEHFNFEVAIYVPVETVTEYVDVVRYVDRVVKEVEYRYRLPATGASL